MIKSRKLKVEYSIDMTQKFKSEFDDELTKQLSKEITDEIDKRILFHVQLYTSDTKKQLELIKNNPDVFYDEDYLTPEAKFILL